MHVVTHAPGSVAGMASESARRNMNSAPHSCPQPHMIIVCDTEYRIRRPDATQVLELLCAAGVRTCVNGLAQQKEPQKGNQEAEPHRDETLTKPKKIRNLHGKHGSLWQHCKARKWSVVTDG
jgi:hypothetical protein